MARSASPRVALIVLALALALPAARAGAQPPPPPPLQPLPPPPAPAGNPLTTAKANLGKVLYWDQQLSSTNTVACGSCHQPTAGGSDPRSIFAAAHATNPGPDGVRGTADDITGSPGVVSNLDSGALDGSGVYALFEQVGGRHAPTFVNAAYAPVLFWDGRATGTFADPVTGATVLPAGAALESQAAGPPVNSAEMAHQGRDWNDVAARVAAATPLALSPKAPDALTAWINGRGYADLFAEAFGDGAVTPARIAMAIASYERTQVGNQTPFDSLIAGTTTLTPTETAGFQLFGQLPCARCHGGALTSDNAFHYIGVRPAAEDSGRYIVTHNLADLGRMKTPILRNAGLRTVFMHDGRLNSLAAVVDFYDRGGDFNAPNKDPLIVPLNLTLLQKTQLLAFLGRPLTDPRVANGDAPFDRPTFFDEGGLAPSVMADGVAGTSGQAPAPVALEPALAGSPAWTVGVQGALGGAHATLVIDDALPPAGAAIPASGSFARQEIDLAGSGAAGGWGSVTLAIPGDPAQYGRALYGRWYVADPAAPGGVASSPAFRFPIFGPHGAGVTTVAVGPGGGTGAGRVATLRPSAPNPFRTATALRFDLARATRVRLTVFNVAGRLTRHLYDAASLAAGAHSVTWDGADDAGRAAPAGIYFYRLETDGGVSVGRVVRVD